MKKEKFDDSVYVHPTAVCTGNVSVGKGSSLWPHSVLRGDYGAVTVGENTSIQDTCVLHGSPDSPVKVGNYVTVTHGAVLHGCTIEDDCMIGVNAVVLDGAVIGKGSIVGNLTVVKVGEQVPPGSIVAGIPGVVKPGKPGQTETLHQVAISYTINAKNYIAGKDTISKAEMSAAMEAAKSKKE